MYIPSKTVPYLNYCCYDYDLESMLRYICHPYLQTVLITMDAFFVSLKNMLIETI